MKAHFGFLPTCEEAALFTITNGPISACVTDCGATLVRLLVPDTAGNIADVVLGYDDCNGYRTVNGACLGAAVGRNANRLRGARFTLNEKEYQLAQNDSANNLHSGPDYFHLRLWNVVTQTDASITFELQSPDGDQGFPGNAVIQVTYTLDHEGFHIEYDAVSDMDTVFNMTNHSYFNLAEHEKTDATMQQLLAIPGRFFCPDDAENIPHRRASEGRWHSYGFPLPQTHSPGYRSRL